MCLHCCIGISLPCIYFSGSKHLEFMSPFYFSPSSFNLSRFVMFKTCGDPACCSFYLTAVTMSTLTVWGTCITVHCLPSTPFQCIYVVLIIFNFLVTMQVNLYTDACNRCIWDQLLSLNATCMLAICTEGSKLLSIKIYHLCWLSLW